MNNKTYHNFIKIWATKRNLNNKNKDYDRFMKGIYLPDTYKKIRYLFLFKPKMEMLSIFKSNRYGDNDDYYGDNDKTMIKDAVNYILSIETVIDNNKTYHNFLSYWLNMYPYNTVGDKHDCDKYFRKSCGIAMYKNIRYLFLSKPQITLLVLLNNDNVVESAHTCGIIHSVVRYILTLKKPFDYGSI